VGYWPRDGAPVIPVWVDPVVSDDRLLRLIGDTEGLMELEEFAHELLHAVHRAVPSDWVSLNDIGPDPDTIWGIVEPPLTITLEQQQAFSRYAYQNPLIERITQTRDGRAVRFSDLITPEELHAREIYTQYYALVGVEHQIAFTLPHEKDRLLGVALSRRANAEDFSDAERDLLNQARPFLIQAYRNAVRYSELLASTVLTNSPPRTPELERLVALGLTRRRAEVLQMLAAGAGEREIATQLAISHRTVQKHLQNCYRQLGVNNRSEAGAIAWSTIDNPPAAGQSTRQPSGEPEASG
jgi:DNA-binding CsgD family transcriptional regulator